MNRLLLVEDNAELAFGLQAVFEREGFAVRHAASATDAQREILLQAPDLIILDVGLPKTDGFRLLELLRRQGDATPVVMLTARTHETDIVHGLSLGADDYIAKPFSLSVLVARVRAILRRQTAHDARVPDAELHFGSVTVDQPTRRAFRGGAEVVLTPKEFDLLVALLRSNGAVAPRRQLQQQVWGYREDIATRTVDMHVRQLRAKLEDDPANPVHLLTVWGLGYRLQR
jgi:two-component system, OmpR family, alkaline phosphatase synthesis response regulator PhoP